MEVFVFFSKKNEQQLTILCDVAVNGIVSYCNAMQAGAHMEGQTDAGGHGRTCADAVGDNGKVGREVGGWNAALRGHGVVFVVRLWTCASTYSLTRARRTGTPTG